MNLEQTQLSVSWEAYQMNICRGLIALQQRGEFVDMTIAADGHFVKVHQMVLSLVSPYIKELITSAQCQHPVIFLNKISYYTLESLLEYAYTGEVVVSREEFGEFLEACRVLHIKGLEDTLNFAATAVGRMYSKENLSKKEENILRKEDLIIEEEITTFEDGSVMEDIEMLEDPFPSDDLDNDDVIETTVSPGEIVNENDETDKEKPVGNAAKPLSVQYSVSNHGRVQLVLNRFIYSLRNTRKNNERYWRCVNQQITSCPAIVSTDGHNVTSRMGAHNHTFHDAQILKRVGNGNMFQAWHEAEGAAVEKQQQNDVKKSIRQKTQKKQPSQDRTTK